MVTSLASYSNILGTFTVKVTVPNIVHITREHAEVFVFPYSSPKHIPQGRGDLIEIRDSGGELNGRTFL